MSKESYDTKKMSVSEIREVLIDTFGCDADEVNETKGKSRLVEILEDSIAEEEGVEDIDFGEDEDTGDFEEVDEKTDDDIGEVRPALGSVGWHDSVMAQFTDDELIKGNPTVDGMRRMVECVVGTIKSIKTKVVASPEQITLPGATNDRRATVVVRLTLHDGSSFDGAGDVYWGNTDKEYRNYAISVAETRAEGRALKRALRLKKVNAAEELAEKVEHDPMPVTNENVEDGPITGNQLQFIDIFCKGDRLNINVAKLLEHMNMSDNISKLTHIDGVAITKLLNKFQNQSEDIPAELLGFEANWRN